MGLHFTSPGHVILRMCNAKFTIKMALLFSITCHSTKIDIFGRSYT